MRLLILSILTAFLTLANASGFVGTVQQANGSVKVKSEGSLKKIKIKSGYEIKKGDLISTSKKATAVINLADGSTMALDVSSTVHFAAANSADQQDGKVYYKITTRDTKNALKIKTPFAIIGIKGTTFIVNAKEKEAAVSLKEGLIGVQSIKEEFALYRKQLEEEYKKYIDEEREEYEAFVKEAEEGVAEMTKEFEMHAGTSISFDGQKAKESGWTEKDEQELNYFEALVAGTIAGRSDIPAGETQQSGDSNENVESEEKSEPVSEPEVQQGPTQEPQQNNEQAQPEKQADDDTWNEEDDADLDAIEAQFRK